MRRRNAFALIELPVFLFVLFLSGLLIAFVFSRFSGPAPWYVWLICGLILPVCLLLLVGASLFVDRLQNSHKVTPEAKTRVSGTGKTSSDMERP